MSNLEKLVMQLSSLCEQLWEEPLILLSVFATGIVLFLFWRILFLGLGAFIAISAVAHCIDTKSIEMKSDAHTPRNVSDLVNLSEHQTTYEFVAQEQDLDLEDEADVGWSGEIRSRSNKSPPEDLDEFKPASQISLLDTDNEEYKARRSKVLKRSDGVVMQKTFR